MRNVQQWTRDLDNTTIRVFPFSGIMKTAAAFLEGTRYRLSNPKRVTGIVLHTGQDQFRIVQGEYIILRENGLVHIVGDESQLFNYMGERGYRYLGKERVRNTQLTEEIDSGMIRRWAAWADNIRSGEIDQVDSKIYPQRDSVEDVQAGKPQAISCGDNHAPEGWECTRDPGHEGPCAAVQKETVEPVRTGSSNPYQFSKKGSIAASQPPAKKRKTFFERLMGFLPIFRR